ncbi:MAG: FAD-dependent oxidoreductase, partial [Methylococcales bacterium]
AWQAVYPKKIIFCEGYQALQNPWFSWLPFQLAKGEIITLEYQGELADKILNFGHWLIPLDHQTLRIGATFDRTHLNNHPTLNAQAELLKSMTGVLPSFSTKVLKHQANIRPCTLDKRPFIGEHPSYSSLVIFNGFGAKGSLQIPWYCQQFTDSLLNNLPSPSSIQRYYATHFTG